MRWVEQDARAISQRLQGYVAQLARRIPNIWSAVDLCRAGRGKQHHNWPNWCFLPTEGAYGIAAQSLKPTSRNPTEEELRNILPKNLGPATRKEVYALIGEIDALVSWRPTQGIYRFHPEVFSALWETSLEGDIPVEVLYRLPEWCCYIDCYGRNDLAGFFVSLGCTGNGEHPNLNILLDKERDGLTRGYWSRYSIPISTRKSISDMFEEHIEGFIKAAMKLDGEKPPEDFATKEKPLVAQRFLKTVKPLMSLVLYLCSTTAEFRDLRGTDNWPLRVKPIKTKRGVKIFPPDHPTIWETGYRIGQLIQKARADRIYGGGTGEGTHSSPEPHIRKPHWHSFWKGPKDDPKKREVILHWLPPIPVGYKPGYEIVPTIYPVK